VLNRNDQRSEATEEIRLYLVRPKRASTSKTEDRAEAAAQRALKRVTLERP